MKAWPRYATLAALVMVLAILSLIYGYRLGLWGLGPVFGGFQTWALPAAGLSALLGAVSAGALVFRQAWLGAVAALAVAATGAGLGYLPIWMKGQAESVPAIHDITTDTIDPPLFVAVLEERADAPNPPEYDTAQTERQLEAYPDIRTLVMPVPLPEAFGYAVDAVKAEGLTIKAAVPSEGRIEATETVPLFGFKDDVVIRLQNAHGTATVVDIRSKSRVGVSDLGFNARRIRSLLDRLKESGGAIEMPSDHDQDA